MLEATVHVLRGETAIVAYVDVTNRSSNTVELDIHSLQLVSPHAVVDRPTMLSRDSYEVSCEGSRLKYSGQSFPWHGPVMNLAVQPGTSIRIGVDDLSAGYLFPSHSATCTVRYVLSVRPQGTQAFRPERSGLTDFKLSDADARR